jgi:hypothetical protein
MGSQTFASLGCHRLCSDDPGERCDHGQRWSAQARLVRINGDPPTIVDLPAFGSTGPYLKISGTFDGELDPFEAHNAPIADIDRAPRSNGKVRYTSTFYVLRPQESNG